MIIEKLKKKALWIQNNTAFKREGQAFMEALKELNPSIYYKIVQKSKSTNFYKEEKISSKFFSLVEELIEEEQKIQYSQKDLLLFANFIRDNYYGIGAPRLQSYEPSKYPNGTLEEIFLIWKNQKR